MKKSSKKSAKRPPTSSGLMRQVSALKKRVAQLSLIHRVPRLSNPSGSDQDQREAEGRRRAAARVRDVERLVDSGRMPGGGGAFTSNMVKALRMHPWSNTVEDWQRLFEAEYALKYRRSKGKRTTARRSNPARRSPSGAPIPRGGPADSHARTELLLYIDNDGDLYRQQTEPIQKNLIRKIIKGTYSRPLSVKLWEYLADNAAKKYTREFGTGDGFGVFNKATRHEVADHLASNFFRSYQDGEYAHLVAQLTPKGRRTNPRPDTLATIRGRRQRLEKAGYGVKVKGGVRKLSGRATSRETAYEVTLSKGGVTAAALVQGSMGAAGINKTMAALVRTLRRGGAS